MLPLEVATGLLSYLARVIVTSFHMQSEEEAPELLKVITDPVTKLFIQVGGKDCELCWYSIQQHDYECDIDFMRQLYKEEINFNSQWK